MAYTFKSRSFETLNTTIREDGSLPMHLPIEMNPEVTQGKKLEITEEELQLMIEDVKALSTLQGNSRFHFSFNNMTFPASSVNMQEFSKELENLNLFACDFFKIEGCDVANILSVDTLNSLEQLRISQCDISQLLNRKNPNIANNTLNTLNISNTHFNINDFKQFSSGMKLKELHLHTIQSDIANSIKFYTPSNGNANLNYHPQDIDFVNWISNNALSIDKSQTINRLLINSPADLQALAMYNPTRFHHMKENYSHTNMAISLSFMEGTDKRPKIDDNLLSSTVQKMDIDTISSGYLYHFNQLVTSNETNAQEFIEGLFPKKETQQMSESSVIKEEQKSNVITNSQNDPILDMNMIHLKSTLLKDLFKDYIRPDGRLDASEIETLQMGIWKDGKPHQHELSEIEFDNLTQDLKNISGTLKGKSLENFDMRNITFPKNPRLLQEFSSTLDTLNFDHCTLRDIQGCDIAQLLSTKSVEKTNKLRLINCTIRQLIQKNAKQVGTGKLWIEDCDVLVSNRITTFDKENNTPPTPNINSKSHIAVESTEPSIAKPQTPYMQNTPIPPDNPVKKGVLPPIEKIPRPVRQDPTNSRPISPILNTPTATEHVPQTRENTSDTLENIVTTKRTWKNIMAEALKKVPGIRDLSSVQKFILTNESVSRLPQQTTNPIPHDNSNALRKSIQVSVPTLQQDSMPKIQKAMEDNQKGDSR